MPGDGGGPYLEPDASAVEREEDLDVDEVPGWRSHDGVASLRDTSEETGDEDELDDLFTLDTAEARAVGADLDPVDGPEPQLD